MARELRLRSMWCLSIAGLALALQGCSEHAALTAVDAPARRFTVVQSLAAVTSSDFSQGPNAAFAANAISPNASSCTVGSNCSVQVGMWVGGGAFGGTYGIDFKVYFDPTVLQAVSVTTASGSPYPNSPAVGDGHTSPANSIDNSAGVVFYSAMSAPGAGFNGGSPFAVATIVFKAISAGSSALQLRPDQWLNAYGPFGNGGLATSGTMTVTGATQAPSTTTVSFGAGPFPYTGSAYVATATVSPAGSTSIAYSGDCINAGGTCTATATYAGDATHTGSSATASITITKAPSSTTVSFGPGPFVYTGTAFTATASVSPAGTAAISYAGDCTNAGNTCQATATYAGNGNYLPSSASTNIVITLPVATSADQCKKGGWMFVTDDLGNLFKNQGDCVSYVATKGKNTGAGAP